MTNLLYDGVDLIAEYDSASTVLRRYVHGHGVDEPLLWYEGAGTTSKTWLYADHQGSIVVGQADSAGTSSVSEALDVVTDRSTIDNLFYQ
ncbi:MAG: hypothetical protein ABTQ24_12955 [Azonexus sp.]